MADQTTRGHQFLKKNFGAENSRPIFLDQIFNADGVFPAGDTAIPRGTWQIDPFGHSNTEAWLLGAEAGFESLYWGRTDYQDSVRQPTPISRGAFSI
jgi:alpha-mannosidase